MGLFSFLGLGGGSTTVTTQVAQTSQQNIDIAVTPQIGVDVDVDTSPIAAIIGQGLGEINKTQAIGTDVLRTTQATQGELSNVLQAQGLVSSALLEQQVQSVDVQNKLEASKLEFFGEVFKEGKTYVVLATGALLLFWFLRK